MRDLPQNRNDLIDNAKGILILFVVLGHLLERHIETDSVERMLYLFLYSFHMPAFVFLSGLLATSNISRAHVRKWVNSLLVPLIVFQVIFEFHEILLTGEVSNYTYQLRPYWVLWFLLSLFIWRCSLPVVNCLRFPLLIAFSLAILAGYVPETGMYLGISRTLVFFPFFLLGHFFGRPLIQQTERSVSRIYPLLLLSGVMLYFILNRNMNHEWLWGRGSYASLGNLSWTAGLIRVELYVVSCLAMLSFFSLVPHHRTFWSKLGKNSMPIFLWHVIMVKWLALISPSAIQGSVTQWSLAILIFEALIMTLLLGSDCVASRTTELINKCASCICRYEESAGAVKPRLENSLLSPRHSSKQG